MYFKELNFEKTLEKVREEHWKLDGRMQIYFLKKSWSQIRNLQNCLFLEISRAVDDCLYLAAIF